MQTGGEVEVHAFMVMKSGPSDEQFHNHWRDPYLAIRVKGIVRYVQDHTYGSVPRFDGWAPLIDDGLPAVWFEDIRSATGLHADPDFRESRADEENLVSLPRADQYADGPPLFDVVVESAFRGRTELEAATDARTFRADGLRVLEELVDAARSSAAWTYEERWIRP